VPTNRLLKQLYTFNARDMEALLALCTERYVGQRYGGGMSTDHAFGY